MKNRYKFLGLIITIAIAFFITGCGCSNGNFVVEEEVPRRASTGERWTVLIYMSAGDMEEKDGRAHEVLASLSYDLPENVTVIVETGGCRAWQTDEIKNDRIQDFIVQKNGIRLINESLIKNMGESETYAEFLARNIEKYPAENYVSVIWGNGGGSINGVSYDATYDYDPLTVTEIAAAHASVGTQFDIIGFDASFMSNLETAAALSIFCDYMVASEDIMPISGWNYRNMFEYISNNPQASAVQVGQVICDGVIEAAGNDKDRTTVMAVTDLSKATRMVQSFDSMARMMTEATNDSQTLRKINQSTLKVLALGANSDVEGHLNLVDMASLARCIFDATSNDSARIENVATKTVVYKASTSPLNEMCGLGVYYPIDSSADTINKYREICPSLGYMEYIDGINTNELVLDRTIDYKETLAWQDYSAKVEGNSISAFYDPRGFYKLTVATPEVVSNAWVNLYKYDEESGKYLYMLSDNNTKRSDNLYTYEFQNKIFELNGTPVNADLVIKGKNYEIYSIPVKFQDMLSSIRVMKSRDGENYNYTVLGVWQGIDNSGAPDRRFDSIGAGDVIVPVYKVYGGKSGEYYEGKSLRLVFGGINIKEKTIPDGDYMVSYTTRDIYGVEVESNTTTVAAVKGKLKIATN